MDAAGNFSGWTSPVTADLTTDNDHDGFVNAWENILGTNTDLACGVNAWPPDVNNDRVVNSLDMAIIARNKGTKLLRYDINGDGVITDADVSFDATFFGKSC